MNLEEIKEILPHRPPFLFVDKVEEITNTKIIATRTIRNEEPFFNGHFPGHPIMPGALACEAIFQTGAILLSKKQIIQKGFPLVTRVTMIKFKKMIIPPIIITMEADLVDTLSNVYYFKGKVKTNGTLCVSCEFACTLIGE